jgi:hypothetical protein
VSPAGLGAADLPPSNPRLPLPAATLALFLTGCGGGAPLLHPAHVLPPGEVMVGGGLSGELALRPLQSTASPNLGTLQDLAVAPGVAPWAAGRMGLEGSNEAGLTYAGRSLRLDARHAFPLGSKATLSVGLGASAVMAKRPEDADGGGVYGGGADVPVLLGVRSTGDLYALWFGPRVGFEILSGRLQPDPTSLADVQAKHFYAGLTAGARVGFRHVHLALELNASYHYADGSFGAPATATTAAGPVTSTSVQQLSLTPAGALQVTF